MCSGREGVWRSYNDSYVMEAREEDIRQKRKGTGYIFFYMHKYSTSRDPCLDTVCTFSYWSTS